MTSRANAEYRRTCCVPEEETPIDEVLKKYLVAPEIAELSATKNKTMRLMGLQSEALRDLYAHRQLAVLDHTEMLKTLKDLLEQQSKAELAGTVEFSVSGSGAVAIDASDADKAATSAFLEADRAVPALRYALRIATQARDASKASAPIQQSTAISQAARQPGSVRAP